MKRRILIFTTLVCLVILGFITGCSKFKEYKCESGGFIVNFPGTPEEQKQTLNTEAGSIDMYIYSVTKSNMGLAVAYCDCPDNDAEPNDILDGACEGAVANSKGKLLSDLNIEYDSYPGRKIKYEIAGGKIIQLQQVYLVNNRLYTLIVSTEPDDMYSKDITKFFDSFKLIK